ncbi:MAG: class I SAM-dependent methyltransferase [Anaerolineae bacterium]
MLTDQNYLRSNQYRNSFNLDARAQLHANYSVNRYGWQRWVFEQLDLPESGRILELGCGPAWLWQENLPRIPAGWEIALSDLSPGMLQAARENLGVRPDRFRFQVADAQQIPFGNHCFDAVIANHMLYHVPDPGRACSEVRRVLAPGGRFYAATNGRAHLQELHDLFAQAGIQDIFGPERGFSLENGGDQLAPYFPDVTIRRYPDGLVVTAAEPLVAYARSVMVPGQGIEALKEFERIVREQIEVQGAIRIAKDSGVLIGRRAE